MMEDDGEKQNRILLRPWLENMLERHSIPGLEWYDEEKTMFQVRWKHRSKKDWSLDDSRVFLEWARNTGRLKEEGANPDFAQLKTRFRCALNKAPDIEEVSALRSDKGEEPFKVYRFTKHNDSSVRKVTVAMSSSKKVKSNEEEGSNFPWQLNEEKVLPDVLNEDGEWTVKDGTVWQAVHSDLGYSDQVDSSNKFKVETEPVTGKTCIPLSVELMTSSGSDCSASDHSSPTSTDRPFNMHDGNTAKSTDDVQSIDFLESETFKSSSSCRTPLLNSTQFEEAAFNSEEFLEVPSSNEHMLQVASLFVEAEEKRRQQATRTTDQNPHLVIDETCASEHQNLIIIKPADYAHEAPAAVAVGNCAEWITACPVPAQLVHRFSAGCHGFAGNEFKPEPIDLTKKDMNKECRINIHLSKSVGSSLFEQVVEGDSREKLMNFIDEINNEELNFQPSDPVEEIRQKVQRNEQLLLSKVKMLYMWEERLKNWEAKLKATEDACFWKNKYLDAKLARSGVFVPESQQHSQQGVFTVGNPGQSMSRLTLPVKGIQREGAVMHTAAIPGTVQDFSQSAARSELVQRPEQPRNLNAQVKRNVGQFTHSNGDIILSLGKVGKRKQVTVIPGDSVLSEEHSLKKRRMQYESPVNDTELSFRTIFAELPILDKFATSGTVSLAKFQSNPVKCAPNQIEKLRYECKPLPHSSISDAVCPTEDVELEKAVFVKNIVDISNVSVPTKRLQESGKEEIFPSSILPVSIPSIAYVLPSVSIAEKRVGGSVNQSTDSHFSPVRNTSSCSTPYTLAFEVISDCDSDGELIIDSSKTEDMEASQTEKKEDDSSSKQNNQNENSTNVEKISLKAVFDSSEKRSLCTNSGTGDSLTARQEKPNHASRNPTDLKIFQEWLKGVTKNIVKEKSSKTTAGDVVLSNSNSMKQVSQRDAQKDAKHCQNR